LIITREYRDLRADDVAFREDVPGWRWELVADHHSCGAGLAQTDANGNVTASTSFY